jgi:murein L,D-transpeptidase YcbB/YkuD
VEQRIDQIRINLERARWVLHEIRGDFVLVDVAGFDVAYFRNDEPVWTSKVIVGRPYRETPIFRSLITYVVLNPTWTIPPGILVKDKLPILKRDPGYLKRNNIRVIDSKGREVNPYSVNWSQYGASRLPPYQLRQDPGEDNALGLVKIIPMRLHALVEMLVGPTLLAVALLAPSLVMGAQGFFIASGIAICAVWLLSDYASATQSA